MIPIRGHRAITPTEIGTWEAGQYSALRRHRDATTPTDDALPDDPLAMLLGSPSERAELRRILRAL